MFSTFGEKLTSRTGILQLMEDCGRALALQPDMRMLGGGNPAAVPGVQQLWRERMQALLADGGTFDRMLVNYDPPQGNPHFIHALAELLRSTFGWEVGPENIAITNGGQSAFFFLFNFLGGPMPDGRHKKILLPLCPEYIGYADQGLEADLFVACRPQITWPEGEGRRRFKYTIDFAAVQQKLQTEAIAAIAVSRPTNPTGNVLTDDEVQHLSALAARYEVPLILDNAYGAPFPNVIFTAATPHWAPHVILTLSLSKLGLPGTRTGIVVAPEPIASAISAATAIAGLANGTIGQQVVLPMVQDGSILDIGPRWLKPYYEDKSLKAQAWTREIFEARGVDWALHVSEGAFFHWLWLRGMSITTLELYERLKARKVLVVPGEYFFFGMDDDWPHRHECLRLNCAQSETVMREALSIIAEEAAAAAK
ncbi:MAG TPA: valine--pyruvate transaminase [Planctomycetaceae bacterium]|nr:valine--pyruvate transaminase [Planctomycetaceae bacterium]